MLYKNLGVSILDTTRTLHESNQGFGWQNITRLKIRVMLFGLTRIKIRVMINFGCSRMFGCLWVYLSHWLNSLVICFDKLFIKSLVSFDNDRFKTSLARCARGVLADRNIHKVTFKHYKILIVVKYKIFNYWLVLAIHTKYVRNASDLPLIHPKYIEL